jgi:hypothetical protein
MPNMSYCAAENTLRAIRQLCDIIEDGGKDEDVRDKHGYEYLAIKQLAEEAAYLSDLCEELYERYN